MKSTSIYDHPARVRSVQDFEDWLKIVGPDAPITCEYRVWSSKGLPTARDANTEIDALANAVWNAYMQGDVLLFQDRPFYYAVKTPKKRGPYYVRKPFPQPLR